MSILNINSVFKIYRGCDTGSNRSITESLVDQFNNSAEALRCYKDVEKECLEKSKKIGNEKNRYYCYMLKIDLTKKIVGYKNGKMIDNGYFSKTVLANNFTQSPKLHDYMVNIKYGKEIGWVEIFAKRLYENL